MASWKNDLDRDPHFILVFLKKRGVWLVLVLPKNSNILRNSKFYQNCCSRYPVSEAGTSCDYNMDEDFIEIVKNESDAGDDSEENDIFCLS